MDKNQKILALIGCAVLALIVGLTANHLFGGPSMLGAAGAGYSSIENPVVIGSATVPVTLTSAYTGAGAASSSRIAVDGYPNLVLAGTYTPNTYGAKVFILLTRSIDGGVTYLPYETISPQSDGTLINTNGTGTTNGSPFVIPGNALGTTASGTAIGFSFDLTAVADFVKVSAKEVTTSTAGTLNVQIKGASN